MAGVCRSRADVNINSTKSRKVLKYYASNSKKPHTFLKKRRINFQMKETLIKQLRHDTVYKVQAKLTNKEKQVEQCRQISNLNALWQLKHKDNVKKGIDSIPTMPVWKMLYSPEYYNTIKEVCTDPFYVFIGLQIKSPDSINIRKMSELYLALMLRVRVAL